MRMGFGLVSLLVTVGIIALLMSKMIDKGGPVRKGLETQEQLKPITAQGYRDAKESITLDGQLNANSRLEYVTVADLVPAGTMQTHFLLQKGDQIIAVGVRGFPKPLKFSELPTGPNDPEAAKDAIIEAYQVGLPLVVQRNGVQVTLAGQKGIATPEDAVPGNNANPTPTGNGGKAMDQINKIQSQIK
ncbi:MAG TPA: hypothetical protein VIL86_09975 [Tepidisphaeraceae bacterium]|jgi:hypothetical protein